MTLNISFFLKKEKEYKGKIMIEQRYQTDLQGQKMRGVVRLREDCEVFENTTKMEEYAK